MIRCDGDTTVIRGRGKELAADFCCITVTLLKNGVMSEFALDKLVKISKEVYNETDEDEVNEIDIEIDKEELKKQMKGEDNDSL